MSSEKTRESIRLRVQAYRARLKAAKVQPSVVLSNTPNAIRLRARRSNMTLNQRILKHCVVPNTYKLLSHRTGDVGMELMYTHIYYASKYGSPISVSGFRRYRFGTATIKACINSLLESGHIVNTGKSKRINIKSNNRLILLPIYKLGRADWTKHTDIKYKCSALGDSIVLDKVLGINKASKDVSTIWQYKDINTYAALNNYLAGHHVYREAYADSVIADSITIDNQALEKYLGEPGEKSRGITEYIATGTVRSSLIRIGYRSYNVIAEAYFGGHNGHIDERQFLLLDGKKTVNIDMRSAHPITLLKAISSNIDFIRLMYSDGKKAVSHVEDAYKLLYEMDGDAYRWTCKVLGISRDDAKMMWSGLLNRTRWQIANKKFRNKKIDFQPLARYLRDNFPYFIEALFYIQDIVLSIDVKSKKSKKTSYNAIYELMELLEAQLIENNILSKVRGVRVHDSVLVQEADAEKVLDIMTEYATAIVLPKDDIYEAIKVENSIRDTKLVDDLFLDAMKPLGDIINA